jgi:hemerythrin superfamily protein
MPASKSTARVSGKVRASGKARVSGKVRRKDAIALLRADHANVSKLFKQYEEGRERAGGKRRIVEQICHELTIHAQIEEEIFYPACREALPKAGTLLAEAKVEHQSLKALIAKLQAAGAPGEELFDAEVKVLGEYVAHHVKEEHRELFPEARKAGLDLKALGEQLERRKAELQRAAGLSDAA